MLGAGCGWQSSDGICNVRGLKYGCVTRLSEHAQVVCSMIVFCRY